MVRGAIAVLLLVTACGVGPVRVGLMPRMAPIGMARDPDPTRVPTEQTVRPGDEGEALEPGEDPLSVGPVSGMLTLVSFGLAQFVGMPLLLGVHGTFDETGLVKD